MLHTIHNCTSREILLRLKSGLTVHLAAGARTAALEGAEINGNQRIASLVDRQLVVIEDAASVGARARPPGRATTKPSVKETSPATAEKADIAEGTRAGGSQ